MLRHGKTLEVDITPWSAHGLTAGKAVEVPGTGADGPEAARGLRGGSGLDRQDVDGELGQVRDAGELPAARSALRQVVVDHPVDTEPVRAAPEVCAPEHVL